ncbi:MULTISPECIES: amino acid ABC transporter permease [unclassified Acidovorax]|uniref:amino acid ABC transporter permease n=1 Tax=unclassified Acidovorax TaxID=2684926 RepID=UPI001C45A275|nr:MULTISPECIES: amino acid ABC transporter permease [unclassified Acidovorax]MBV7427363.1 amino acid ABC transporter permease [Acidovorax sp. sif0732]MBV7448487.1 amino acid ABC transporter permease [Acidovorax sp. sif0715]
MYNWNWSVLWSPSADGSASYLGTLGYGLLWTLLVGLSAWCIALVVGTVVGVARTRPTGAVASIADAYVEVLRSIPLIVQMFLWFYVAPDLLPESSASAVKAWDRYNVVAAIVCLALYTSARIAEQVRAGIQSLPSGQGNAAKALGMEIVQSYRYVLLPVAFRRIIPALTNEFVNIIKNTSVAFTIAVVELMAATRSMQETTFQPFEAFTAATIIYLTVNLTVVKLMGAIERATSIPGYGSTKN